MSKKVLIVEDDDDIRENLVELLTEEGYLAEGASGGGVALSKLRSGEALPSLIILDVMMPGMNGFEFRQAQEADPRIANIPVVVMTADAQAESKKHKLGAKALIRKPLQIEDILKVIEQFAE